jgi:hypothetical protein
MDGYEDLGEMVEESGEAKLHAAYSSNNGIRIEIANWFDERDRQYEQFSDDGWDGFLRVFDFTDEQALKLGEALVRWAKASAAESEKYKR